MKRGRGEQVCASDNTGDPRLRIVDGTGELLPDDTVRANEHEVPGRGRDINRHVAVNKIVEALDACGDGESERMSIALRDALYSFVCGECAARTGVDRFSRAVWCVLNDVEVVAVLAG